MPETTTGPDGSFLLSGIPSGEFSIGATHDRFGPSESINLMQGQDGLTIELRPNTVVEGLVLDPMGMPVAGATVRALGFGFALRGNVDGGVETADPGSHQRRRSPRADRARNR